MTEREAADRLLAALRAIKPLLRHGHLPQAVAVLEDVEAAVVSGLRLGDARDA